MTNLTVHKDNIPIYDIIFQNNFEELHTTLQPFGLQNRRVCIVTEKNVATYYLEEIKQIIEAMASVCTTFVFDEGEENKNLETVQALYEHLILSQFDRHDLLIALGGGVVGDLTGYTSATYLRGIDFIQIPTSLLSQVDSSVGGKTGVDFNQYKNMVGAFYQPKLVYMNLSTLNTLSERQYRSGLGEVIKYGLIMDNDFFYWIESHLDEIWNRDYEALLYMVKKSCECKCKIVEEDPNETSGLRALLNFGHTLGHAIEKQLNFTYTHGECVAIGSELAALLSVNKSNSLKEEELQRIINLYNKFHFPLIPDNLDIEAVLSATKNDKKMKAGQIRFILLHSIGKSYIDSSVSIEDMRVVLNTDAKKNKLYLDK